MGVFSRIDEIWDAGFEVGRTAVNTVVDLAEAPFTDDEYEGFLGTVWGITVNRGAEMVQNLIGPEGVGGELIETLPEPIRHAGRETLEGLEWAYREGVGEPITTAMTMASLAQARGSGGVFGDDMGVWFDGDAWKMAYKTAQSRSPGQAITLAFMTDDILDQEEVIAAEGKAYFGVVSGMWDAGIRFGLMPEVLAAKAFRVTRVVAKRRAFDNYFAEGGGYGRFADDLENLDRGAGARVGQLEDEIDTLVARKGTLNASKKAGVDVAEELDDVRRQLKNARKRRGRISRETTDALAGRIREKYFPDHHEGDLIALEIARALRGETGFAGGRVSAENVMRFFMGEASVVERMAATEGAGLAYRYRKYWEKANTVEDAVPPGTPGVAARKFEDAQDLPAEMLDELDEVSRAFASIDEAVRPTRRLNMMDKLDHSELYRSSFFFAPVRVVRDMRPQHVVYAGDPNSGEQVARMLREAGFSTDEITRFRGEWARSDRFARATNVAPKYQNKAVKQLLEKHFPKATDADIKALMKDFTDSNRAAHAILTKPQRYDADPDISTVAWVDDAGQAHVLQVPLNPSQLKQTVAVADMKALDKFLRSQASKFPDAFAQANEIRGQFIGGVMSRWRPAVLLRPAWTMRVVGDEQLRMMAKIGSVEHLWALLAENRPQYVEKVLQKALVKTGKYDPTAAKRLIARRAATTGGMGLLIGGPVGMGIGAVGSLARNTRAVKRLRRNLSVRTQARQMVEPERMFTATPEGVVGELSAAELTSMGREKLSEVDLGWMSRLRRRLRGETQGEGPLTIHGYEVDQAFGDALSPNLLYVKANSANRQAHYLLVDSERMMWDDTVDALGEWRKFSPMLDDEVEFAKWWERVVNDQWGNNGAGRIAFDDRIGDADARARALTEWLTEEPDGVKFLERAASRFRDDLVDPATGAPIPDAIEAWAQNVTRVADRMLSNNTHGGRMLRRKVANGKRVRLEDVKKTAVGEETPWQQFVGEVHGQEALLLTENKLGQRTKRLVDRTFDRLMTTPTDTLSRNPYFKRVYEQYMEDAIGKFKKTSGEYELTEEALRGLESSARRKALNETRDLLYDLAERSEFSDMMRNIMPFFNAYQEVLTRWAGLAIDNPAFVARARAALYADIDMGGFFQTVEVNEERYFQFRLPQLATEAIGKGVFSKAIDDQGIIRFRADSLNMVTQIVPGVGPLAQLPISAIVTADPKLEDAFKLVLPYGPIRGEGMMEQTFQAFQPAWLRRVTSALREDRSYESAAASIMLTRMADMADGERDPIDFGDGQQVAEFLSEIKTDTRNFMFLRAVASAFSPASVGFHSPYQPYIDHYRELKAANPKTADDEFIQYLADEGVDGFFALSARFSKNNEGLPATIEAEEIRAEYIDLIRRHPEVGSLILGIEGGGAAKFSSAVYEKQLREDTSPGSGVKRRERLSLEEILTDSRVREGWQEYGRISDAIFSEMRSRGLPNLRLAAASDLLRAKQLLVEKIGEKYPLWYDEYLDPDLTKWPTRIGGMRAIVADERLSGRDDIRLLGEYLRVRDAFTGELSARKIAGGASSLDATSNQDLKVAWQAVMDQMLENPTFSDLVWRWLEFDPLSSDTWPKVQRGEMRAAA